MKLHEYYEKNKFNPTAFDILSEEKLETHRLKRDSLYVNKLLVPNLVWRNARVLEAGCSSGENSLLYAQRGARLVLVEPLAASIEKLKSLFKHYGLQDSIEDIFIGQIEDAVLTGKFNIVVIEGFINTLKKRKEVIRKLFQSLENEGLLIISTNDAVGSFIECFKAAIAQLYCLKQKISSFEEKVEAVTPFFLKDFEALPHSRPFELWAKDVLINPIMTANPFYDFDEIVADLDGLNPSCYSSWPSYKSVNDLTWHKNVIDNKVMLKQAVDNYNFRKSSFLFGEALGEKEAMQFLMENGSKNINSAIKEIILAIMKELHEGQNGAISESVRKIGDKFEGRIKQLFVEMKSILEQLNPETYLKCILLRRYWGVPYHYIVFLKNSLTGEKK